jgi:FlaA1/EpsC-like NDP-sugar epimerase
LIQRLITRLAILPRWIIIIIDLSLIIVSTLLGYLLRFNFNWQEISLFHPLYGILISIICWLAATVTTNSYSGIVRYTGIEDGIRLAYTTFLCIALIGAFNLLYYYNVSKNLIPYSVLFIAFPVSFFFLFFYRLLVKATFSYYKSGVQTKSNVVIFGAGQLGIAVKQIIDTNSSNRLKVIGFLEDDDRKAGKEIQGTKIYLASMDFQKLLKKLDARELIIAVNDLSLERKNQLVEECLKFRVRVRSVPPVEKWVRGELDLKQIREVNIEDLLGRESIVIDNAQVRKDINKKVVCITGAAGSIGSELARQIILYEPSVLILIDQAETPLYEIEHELRITQLRATRILVFVADIANKDRIHYIFNECKPEIVFHAAAYKHVPMMESNPSEAVTTNILGTRILADVSTLTGVRRFVMVSTDKAVNPTNVMGCTKRIAEIYVQSLNVFSERRNNSTSFITTRFGNVLGSNGSVIPMFKKQIENGGPVMVTHPEITRYFMTIPEACRLVMEAGVMGEGGEIFIFDMGKPIKIYDLAKKMIMLSGFELGKDIDIVFTGLREGEKLFEELLNGAENTIPTYHEKILKAKVAEYRYADINNFIDLLQDLVNDRNELKMVALMKEIVPEFKSNYSRYEILDRDKIDLN